MATFRVAQSGYNANTDPVQDMAIDNNYQTQITAFIGNTSAVVQSSIYYTLINLDNGTGKTLGFVPYGIAVGSPNILGITTFFPVDAYIYISFFIGLLTGDPYVLYVPPNNSAITIYYMYCIMYLPSQVTSSSASNPPPNIPPYINVAKPNGNAETDSLQNLSWSSQYQSLQIQSVQQFTFSGTTDSNGLLTQTSAHNISYAPTLFDGLIMNNNPTSGSYQHYFNLNWDFKDDVGSTNYDVMFFVGIDANNLYFYANSLSPNTTYSFIFHLIFFIPPTPTSN